MKVKPIPEGYHTITPYIMVAGASRFIDFLIKAFDAKEIHRSAKPDRTVMHATLQIGTSKVMIADGVDGSIVKSSPGAFYLYVNDTDATYKKALAAGAVSLMEPADQFYGDRSGGVKDEWGNSWWMATHIKDVTDEEMMKLQKEHAHNAH